MLGVDYVHLLANEQEHQVNNLFIIIYLSYFLFNFVFEIKLFGVSIFLV